LIEAARKRLPGLRFDLTGIGTWDDAGPFDVILANAVLQWVPDHAALMPRLAGKLEQGGSLAVQMPDNLDEPAHRLMREVAAAGPWAEKLGAAAGSRAPRLPAEWYYTLLLLPHAGARRCVADDVSSCSCGRHGRGRRMVQGQRAASIPRPT